jgi:type IV pilus assembly protein PilA
VKTRSVAVLVILGTVLFLVVSGVIIVAIMVPKLTPFSMAPSEIAAIREIRVIHQAQTQYVSQFGKYASRLAELGPPPSGRPDPQAADFIPNNLASGEKNGYIFMLTATPAGYAINANPKVYNSTGRRTFFSDQRMQIHQNWSQESANASSPELK